MCLKKTVASLVFVLPSKSHRERTRSCFLKVKVSDVSDQLQPDVVSVDSRVGTCTFSMSLKKSQYFFLLTLQL